MTSEADTVSDGDGDGKDDSAQEDPAKDLSAKSIVLGDVVALAIRPEIARWSSIISGILVRCQSSISEAIEQGHKPQARYLLQISERLVPPIRLIPRLSPFPLTSCSTSGFRFPPSSNDSQGATEQSHTWQVTGTPKTME